MKNKAFRQLERTYDIMKGLKNHVSVGVEIGGFYKTFNESIVYVTSESERYCESGYSAVVLKGGTDQLGLGQVYEVDEFGWNKDSDLTSEIVLGFRERLAISLPNS